jgi:hypothetical protein
MLICFVFLFVHPKAQHFCTIGCATGGVLLAIYSLSWCKSYFTYSFCPQDVLSLLESDTVILLLLLLFLLEFLLIIQATEHLHVNLIQATESLHVNLLKLILQIQRLRVYHMSSEKSSSRS